MIRPSGSNSGSWSPQHRADASPVRNPPRNSSGYATRRWMAIRSSEMSCSTSDAVKIARTRQVGSLSRTGGKTPPSPPPWFRVPQAVPVSLVCLLELVLENRAFRQANIEAIQPHRLRRDPEHLDS